jgi:hypothetical protein
VIAVGAVRKTEPRRRMPWPGDAEGRAFATTWMLAVIFDAVSLARRRHQAPKK